VGEPFPMLMKMGQPADDDCTELKRGNNRPQQKK